MVCEVDGSIAHDNVKGFFDVVMCLGGSEQSRPQPFGTTSECVSSMVSGPAVKGEGEGRGINERLLRKREPRPPEPC